MAAAMISAFALAGRSQDVPGIPVVVAAADIAPGDPLGPGALRSERIGAPSSLAERTFGSVEQLVGAVALAPIGTGELVQRAGVLTPSDEGMRALGTIPVHEYSFSVESDRALAGSLVPGEKVDVVATLGVGEAAFTEVVARRATVVDVAQGASGLGTAAITLTLGLDTAGEVLELAHARETGEVSVVRSTRADGQAPAPPRFRP